MQPTDQLGNPLNKGDLVLINTVKGEQILGVVDNVKDGGLLSPATTNPKEALMMAGVITINIAAMSFPFDPRNPKLGNITKVVKPPHMTEAERNRA